MEEEANKCGKQTTAAVATKKREPYTDKNELTNKSNEDIDKTE